VLLALIPLARVLPALLELGLVALAAWGMLAFELVRYTDTRQRVRHPGAGG
jgi:hypothetical protein